MPACRPGEPPPRPSDRRFARRKKKARDRDQGPNSLSFQSKVTKTVKSSWDPETAQSSECPQVPGRVRTMKKEKEGAAIKPDPMHRYRTAPTPQRRQRRVRHTQRSHRIAQRTRAGGSVRRPGRREGGKPQTHPIGRIAGPNNWGRILQSQGRLPLPTTL